MFKCEICSKEFTTKSALTNHSKKCVIKDILEPIEQKEIVNASVSIVESKSRLSKLIDAYKSSYDAEYRHKLELEYKSLGGDIKDLRK